MPAEEAGQVRQDMDAGWDAFAAALDRLAAQEPAAAQAVRACAFLAAGPVPAEWFTNAARQLAEPLRGVAADPVTWEQSLTLISGQDLARVDPQGLLPHRLTQAVIRSRLSPAEAAAAHGEAAALLTASHPGHQSLPASWPGWARLLPHLLALDPEASSPALSDLTRDAVWYMIRRGLARNAHDLARRLYQSRLAQDGPDARRTMRAANTLAIVLARLGRPAEARALNEDTLGRRRRVLGADHPDALTSASNLAGDLRALGEFQAALELIKDIHTRHRRVLGEDHPTTLTAASNLAIVMHSAGEYEAARALDEDTLARRRRVLGADHPGALTSASDLAVCLRALGEYEAARALDEDVLARRQRVLGEDHPDTLTSASNLALDLRRLGEYGAARELDEDVLGRRRRVLGEDHPGTFRSARNLAADLRGLGKSRSGPAT
ncbi:MAG: FxSxx-COOH system tetratricopeptide repeat protein [Trebonia sp.]